MNKKVVAYTLSNLLLFLAAALAAPLFVAVYYSRVHGETGVASFLLSIVVAAVVGFAGRIILKGNAELRNREGIAAVALGWTAVALFGALPFLFEGVFAEPGRSKFEELVFCFFESISGFTTTGATVLTDIESVPHAVLFWRSLTHWLGGMGIVVLAVAILPLLGVGGMQLYRAEAPGPETDRLTPRIAQTAKLMWGIYAVVSAAEFILLWAGGMAPFDAACHTFGTMATGGFSTKNGSIQHYNSLYFDLVILVFMFLAGTNFALHLKLIRGDFKAHIQDSEFRFYAAVFAGAVLLIIWNVMRPSNGGAPVYDSLPEAARYASFQVGTILTTTGYATADFEMWPALSQALLVILMLFGGCAGSTAGGMKHIRMMLLLKHGYVEVKRLIKPRSVIAIRVGGRVVSPDIMRNILGFFFLFMALFAVATCFMAALGMDIVSAGSSVIAAMFNIGPGLGTVGPTDNYAHIPTLGKCALSFCMLLGRLELFTVLALFMPQLWKRR